METLASSMEPGSHLVASTPEPVFSFFFDDADAFFFDDADASMMLLLSGTFFPRITICGATSPSTRMVACLILT